MDGIAIVAFSFSIFGFIGFIYATSATKKVNELEKAVAELEKRLQ